MGLLVKGLTYMSYEGGHLVMHGLDVLSFGNFCFFTENFLRVNT